MGRFQPGQPTELARDNKADESGRLNCSQHVSARREPSQLDCGRAPSLIPLNLQASAWCYHRNKERRASQTEPDLKSELIEEFRRPNECASPRVSLWPRQRYFISARFIRAQRASTIYWPRRISSSVYLRARGKPIQKKHEMSTNSPSSFWYLNRLIKLFCAAKLICVLPHRLHLCVVLLC
jgi:hypothetical protein